MLLPAALLLPAAVAGQTPVSSEPAIEFTAPPFVVPAPLGDSIRFGWLTVPQRHDDPAAGTFRIAVAIIAAHTAAPAPDPIVLIPGGPGESQVATAAVAVARSVRVGLHRAHRAVIVLDPRGHGLSEPHACPGLINAAPLDARDTTAEQLFVRRLADCGTRAAADGIRLDALSSIEAARDLDVLRRALRAPALNLIGASYGTRIAAEAMREVPHAVRSVMLHGPVPPVVPEGVRSGQDAADMPGAVFRRCAEDPACRAAFPQLERDYMAVMARAEHTPIDIRVDADHVLSSGSVLVDSTVLRSGLLELGFSRDLFAGAPLLIHTLAVRELEPLARLAAPLLNELATPTIRAATHYAFLCNDGSARDDPAARCRALLGDGYAVPPGRAFASDIPALIMTGEFDPRTPPADARLTAQSMSRSQVVIIPWYGHQGLPDCAFQVTDAFILDPGAPVRTDCMADVPHVQFAPDVVRSRWLTRATVDATRHPLRAGVPVALVLILLSAAVVLIPLGSLRGHSGGAGAAMAWAASAAALALLIASIAATVAGAQQHMFIPMLGVTRAWSWVAFLPWVLLVVVPCAIAVLVRTRRHMHVPRVQLTGIAGAVLVLALWALYSLT